MEGIERLEEDTIPGRDGLQGIQFIGIAVHRYGICAAQGTGPDVLECEGICYPAPGSTDSNK
jgi:hypothetical protein